MHRYIYFKTNNEIEAIDKFTSNILENKENYIINNVKYSKKDEITSNDIRTLFAIGDIVEVPLTDDRLITGEILGIIKTLDKGILINVENAGYIDPDDVTAWHQHLDNKYNIIPLA